jgi:ferritin-like metal-binding protein YciE
MAPVPELLLKKRNRDAAWAEKRATAALEARKKAREQRKEIFKRAEQYVNEYRQQVRRAAGAMAKLSHFLQSRPTTFTVANNGLKPTNNMLTQPRGLELSTAVL